MKPLNLKEKNKFCTSNLKSSFEKKLAEEDRELLEKAREILYKSMNRTKALVVCDYIFTDLTIEEVAELRHYSDRSVKKFLKEAEQHLEAL